jgi:flavin reductase (DIM6/NTAB) family NADH-FMN oxidoreductase RutF
MELPPDRFKRFLPLPVTLITTIDTEKIANAAPYSCVMPILRPLELIALASALPRDTLRNIRQTREFVVNVMGRPGFRQAMQCARNYPPEVDELVEVGLKTLPPKKVSPPRVAEALGWIEAVLEQEVTGENYVLIIGRVLCAEINDRYWQGDKLTEPPLVLLSPQLFSLGENLVEDQGALAQVAAELKY